MQLDKTQIAIRERAMLEIEDLSLHVLRAYAGPLLVTFAFGAVPVLALNHWLIGWMADVVYEEQFPYRFMWNMMLLIYLEAQLASIFATCYLGQSVFLARPSIRQVVMDVVKLLPQIAWCQLIVRAVLPAWLCYLLMQRYRDELSAADFLVPVLVLYAMLLRAARPFINEIVVLEQNPMRGTRDNEVTVGRRSALLHGPSASDLLMRSIGAMCLGVLLWIGFYGIFLFCSGILLNDWKQGWVMIACCYPLSLWMVAFFFTVVRFLTYLDVRIRQEGWEVELKLRAEAAKLMGHLA